ncbi:hypothetical protein [Streptomyces sp. NPDC093568]|uniref:hypothetical protein n=1 Tax=Streptomyces sp. NPDC093568 TaxID=3366041 RepID=UPI0037F67910
MPSSSRPSTTKSRGGGGDYGPNSGGFDQLGFGTLAFTRDRATATDTAGSAGPSASAASPSASAAGPDPRPQSGATASPSASASPASTASGGDLAATGTNDVIGWTAATGITALAGGLLLLRRRDRGRRESR